MCGEGATRAVEITLVDQRLRLLRYCREAGRPAPKFIYFTTELNEFVGLGIEPLGNILVLSRPLRRAWRE